MRNLLLNLSLALTRLFHAGAYKLEAYLYQKLLHLVDKKFPPTPEESTQPPQSSEGSPE